MDFFSTQQRARKRTGLLLTYMVLAVLGTACGLYVVLALILGLASPHGRNGYADAPAPVPDYWHPDIFILATVAVCVLVVCGMLYKYFLLRKGGAYVAESLGGRLVPPNSMDPDERRLLNVVEEMALASGVPVPPVYLLEHQRSINAFAAGYAAEDAVIGVSLGTVKALSREELQGVIAHEFSHILNGDMRMNIRLIGLLSGILLIGLLGRGVLELGARSRGKGAAAAAVTGLALMIVGYAGFFFGRLIKMAISRQREYLADASAVQFTRNPGGIAGALKKIGGWQHHAVIRHPKAEEASHMFFASGLRRSLGGLLSTHPPLSRRILALDPSFNGTFPVLREEDVFRPPEETKETAEKTADAGAGPDFLRRAIMMTALTWDDAMRQMGAPLYEHVRHATDLLDAMPAAVRDMCREPSSARAVVYHLLLNRDEEVLRAQLQRLDDYAEASVLEDLHRFMPFRSMIKDEYRLPLLDLCMPALKSLSVRQAKLFLSNIQYLTDADNRRTLFELALQHVLRNALRRHFEDARPSRPILHSLQEAGEACSRVLSAAMDTASGEGGDPADQLKAVTDRLPPPAGKVFHYIPSTLDDVDALDAALEQLRGAIDPVKDMMMRACLLAVTRDGRIERTEIELFRCIAAVLDRPVPLVKTGDDDVSPDQGGETQTR